MIALAVAATVIAALPRLGLPVIPPRTLWSARGFDHYRMDYHISGLVDCQVEVEVHTEQVSRSHTTPEGGAFCGLMSVTGLFNRIDQYRRGPRCGPNGCDCDGPETVEASFDPWLGYPTVIEQRLRPDLRWQYFGYWVHHLVGGGCMQVGYVGTRIEVLSVLPQP